MVLRSILIIISIVSVLASEAQAAAPKRHSIHQEQFEALPPVDEEVSATPDSLSPEAGPSAEAAAEPGVIKPPATNDQPLAKVYSGGRLSLEDCLKLSQERSGQVRGAEFGVVAARGQLAEASANLWPVLEYQYRVAPVPTNVDDAFNTFFDGQVTAFNSIHLGLGLPIMTFGQLHTAKSMARGGVDAARFQETKTREDVAVKVKQLYYGILMADEMIKLLNDASGQLKGKISEAEGKEDGGVDPYNLLQLKSFDVELDKRLAEAEENRMLAFDGLKIQMNLDIDTQIELDADSLRPVARKLGAEQEYLDAAMSYMPDANLVDIGVQTKRKQYQLEKFKLLPRVGIGAFVDVGRSAGPIAGISTTDDFSDPFNFTRAGLGLQVQGTIDFHGAYGRIKKAKAEYFKASYEGMIAKRGLALDIKRAYLAAKRAKDDVSRMKKAQSISQQMVFMSKMNSDIGVGDQSRYADALKSLLLNKAQYLKSVFDYNIALAELERRVGRAQYEEFAPATAADEEDLFNYDEGEDEGLITIDSFQPGDLNVEQKGEDNGKPAQ